ncbi:hypothetical protein TNCV_4691501 [Trichonephila clavipes]|nr:hypothetical protein TNCV_4691501 [Trichonephila clavipes]
MSTPLSWRESSQVMRAGATTARRDKAGQHASSPKRFKPVASARKPGHITLRFPSVWFPEKISAREALQLGRRIHRLCERLGLVTTTGILRTWNPPDRHSRGLLCSGLCLIL